MKTYQRELAQVFRSAAAGQAEPALARFRVLGVRVDAAQTHDVVARMEDWISESAGCHFIAVTGGLWRAEERSSRDQQERPLAPSLSPQPPWVLREVA
jgi:hypothetical protein